ncbi:CYTH domain-containing protein [Clostridium botulinum]|uniref:class IV adenylate cyclase n=1 Tax=Clostridium botulinum TaxID=1491 RepID=UPI0007DE71D2|nr:CYTH domain-containing protein [Clostridium botulinum]KEI82793.1 adenylate cyclase [Clostridium botulinum B2 331]NEZ75022.1 CYTH domain-containing protein [Clostridium botulinum]NFA00252.1 CYTH domain-containing protein [Clostridium botulinum]NFA33279.1 CYTH domain-containing protein [Clostridium botulinum]NFA85246.1 CYTH domain-containing protein [Clostridium botulinum]
MKEIETRIIKIDIEEIRKKLLDLGAIKVKEESQINNIYDFPDKKLLKSKGYARIRYIKDVIKNEEHYYMTVKKLISQEKYKVMEENETEILDFKEGGYIFKALGLELIESISKFRESYKYKETLVEIDINDKSFCPFPYIELESNNEEELEELVELLGYSMNDTTPKTIYEILNEEKVK